MKNILTAICLGLLVFVLSQKVNAQENTEEGAKYKVALPASATKIAEDVYSLGTKTDNGKEIEGLMFIHKKNEFLKNEIGSNKPPKSCYTYLARGAKWKVLEDYLVDPANSEGILNATVSALIAGGVSKWEDAADGVVNGSGPNIIGDEVAGIVDGADEINPDGKNELMWGDVDSPGAIAVTIVWGIFGGPISGRELVEWDQVYDQVDFDWSAEAGGVAGKMDLDNILTHEHGHAFGMGHPGSSCVDETMYAYADYAEILKRDLNTGDIQGINSLY